MLHFLVEHAGRLVTEEELLAHVWPKVYVQPEAIKSQIHEIRKILGDDPKNPRFIETSARRGYQFIAPVADATDPASSGRVARFKTRGSGNAAGGARELPRANASESASNCLYYR